MKKLRFKTRGEANQYCKVFKQRYGYKPSIFEVRYYEIVFPEGMRRIDNDKK